MSLSRKALNFDLSTNEVKKHFKHTAEAYNQIKDFMLDHGFEHRQYSGYVSKEMLDDDDITILTFKLSSQCPWLSSYVQKFDVTDIGEQYDLTHLLTSKTLQKDKNLKKNLNTQDSAIEKMKQKIAKIEKSGKLEKYSSKQKSLER